MRLRLLLTKVVPARRLLAQLFVAAFSVYNLAHNSLSLPQTLQHVKRETQLPVKTEFAHESKRRILYLQQNSPTESLVSHSIHNRTMELTSKALTTVRNETRRSPREAWSYGNCEPTKDWQTSMHPNCNSLHELSIDHTALTRNETFTKLSYSPRNIGLKVLSTDDDSAAVLFQTSFLRHQPMDEVQYERQRINALVKERLTWSPHVTDIYGYCGLSSIVEHANGGSLSNLLHQWDISPREKLTHAIDIVQSVADLHNADQSDTPLMVHRDLDVNKFAIIRGKLKLNDFSHAWFLRRHNATKSKCMFQTDEKEELHIGYNDVNSRSPEELRGEPLSEKIDVYSIGALLFYMLTASPMYYCESGDHCFIKDTLGSEAIRKLKVDGVSPKLPAYVEENTDAEISAIRHAMRQALLNNVTARPTAQQIADSMRDSLAMLEEKHATLSCPGRNMTASKGPPPRVYLAGLVRDASLISTELFHKLVKLNCKHGFGIHIVTESGKDGAIAQYEQRRAQYSNHPSTVCAPFVIINEPDDIEKTASSLDRVDKIAFLRDFQRDRLELSFNGRATDRDVVILIDFDLFSIPSIESITEETCNMIHRRDHDVVCAAGVMHRPYGYYDTFATILKPDTFVYPMRGRLMGSRRGENLALVRSDDTYGTVTQEHILAYFENKKHQDSNGAVPVRSCFGGMAMYRASKWFNHQCRYSMNADHLQHYANKADGRPCEHVVFHLCLAKSDESTQIAVQPKLRTLWDEPMEVRSRLVSGDGIRGGLVTVSKRASEGARLENGKYSLRINETGNLVVERTTNSTTTEIVWRADINTDYFHDKWSSMFLIVEKNGNLRLIQQVQQVRKDLPAGQCKLVDATGTSCRVEVWSSNVRGKKATYFLELGNNGSLRVVDMMKRLLWTNSEPFLLPTNKTTDYARFHNSAMDDRVKLDFFVFGAPKCGTTTLLHTFERHPETAVPPMEECSLDQTFKDVNAYKRLTGHLASATNDTSKDIKRGIKCPFGLTTPMAIERLKDWFPSARLIFGMRHPVMQFQSYYNYRVLNFHKGEIEGPVPPPESLIGSNDWVRVSTEKPRFEKILEKLGKTKNSAEPLTPFKVFLYTLEQMEDDDTERDASFRKALGDFLQLKTPIEPLSQENINTFQGKKGFEETIDICDSEHDHLRSVLVENGKKTRKWILDEFLKSPDVTVANLDHFTETVYQWGIDPCVKEGKKEAEERT